MALDEFIFGKVMRFLKNRKERNDDHEDVVKLESIKPRLTILARAITGTRWKGLTFFGIQNRSAAS